MYTVVDKNSFLRSTTRETAQLCAHSVNVLKVELSISLFVCFMLHIKVYEVRIYLGTKDMSLINNTYVFTQRLLV